MNEKRRIKLVRQLTQRKTITIPSEVLEQVGSKPGDLFEITNDGYRIILIPKVIEDKFTEQEWKKLNQIAKEKGTVYKEAINAKSHLKDLTDEV
jgi:AbrB family looped-hinge helix DNA binding protein